MTRASWIVTSSAPWLSSTIVKWIPTRILVMYSGNDLCGQFQWGYLVLIGLMMLVSRNKILGVVSITSF